MRNVLVTGGTRGLGLNICRRLLKDGYSVIATGRSRSDKIGELIRKHENASFRTLNLKDTASFSRFARELISDVGSLYGLVNNAAIGRDGVLATMHDSEIEELISVNITGTVIFTKYIVRQMLRHGGGRVINISSIVAMSGFNGLSVYSATKSALHGFTRSLARELGRVDITVNAVAPGYMKTDMSSGLSSEQLSAIRRRTPLRQLTSPTDVAGTVAYLLSEESGMITGVVIPVDGGRRA